MQTGRLHTAWVAPAGVTSFLLAGAGPP